MEALASIRGYVRHAAEQAGIERKRAYKLQLAVDEIATNIVVHGYVENGQQGNVRVLASLDDEHLTIVLEDTSVPFNPLNHPAPSHLDLPLEARPYGGLGVYLAVQNVDHFHYEYRDGANRNIFVVHRGDELPAGESPPSESPAK
jgi:serine/threonine-protein kinase RsbW